MNPGQPSRTAVRVAIRRAAHQVLDRPVVFDDPLALQIIGREVADALRADPRRFEGPIGGAGLRAFLAVRSRVAEDALADAIRHGVRQYVILGAGLDTYAYRHDVSGLRVFEVDEPATQAWKRTRLEAVGLSEPESLTFVPVDFEQQMLAESLGQAGLDASQPAFFSWLGVTPYLQKNDVWATLQTVALHTRAGGGVAFDYAIPPESLNFLQRAAFSVLARRVAAAGEPFRSFFHPPALEGKLREFGFGRVFDRDAESLNTSYVAGRSDRLSVGPMGHIVTAWR